VEGTRTGIVMFSSPVVATGRGIFVDITGTPGAASGSFYGIDIDSFGHANMSAATALRIASPVSATTLRSIEVTGTAPSYHQPALMVGAAAAPSARLHVQEPTINSEVFRIESVATNDDPSERVTQGRVATTDATQTTLETIAIPASTTVAIYVFVTARRTGGTAGTAEDGAGYVVSAVMKNVAGTATIIGAVATTTLGEDQAAWDATITVSGANALIRVTGAADNDVVFHSTTRTWRVSA